MEMPFGKHRGESLRSIPVNYLVWVCRNIPDLDWWLKKEIVAEIKRRSARQSDQWNSGSGRQSEIQNVIQKDAVRQWCRKAALLAHPDRGGSVQLMQLINELRDAVR
jgi:hypothetical protein